MKFTNNFTVITFSFNVNINLQVLERSMVLHLAGTMQGRGQFTWMKYVVGELSLHYSNAPQTDWEFTTAFIVTMLE